MHRVGNAEPLRKDHRMIYELEKAKYGDVRPLFEGWRLNLRIGSVLDQNIRGTVFVDNVDRPQTSLLWVHDMFCLAGDENNRDFDETLDSFTTETIAPRTAKIGLGYFAVQVHRLQRWESEIRDLLKHRDLRVNYECKYTFNPVKYSKFNDWKEIPSGFSISRIDRNVLGDSHCEVLLNAIRRYWVSVDRFAEKGIGFCMRHGRVLISCCFTAYLSGNEYEIRIDTYDAEYRNRGFAALTARTFIDYCLANDLTPVWSADRTNAPSIAIAEKLGFEKVVEYPDYYFYFVSQ